MLDPMINDVKIVSIDTFAALIHFVISNKFVGATKLFVAKIDLQIFSMYFIV